MLALIYHSMLLSVRPRPRSWTMRPFKDAVGQRTVSLPQGVFSSISDFGSVVLRGQAPGKIDQLVCRMGAVRFAPPHRAYNVALLGAAGVH